MDVQKQDTYWLGKPWCRVSNISRWKFGERVQPYSNEALSYSLFGMCVRENMSFLSMDSVEESMGFPIDFCFNPMIIYPLVMTNIAMV